MSKLHRVGGVRRETRPMEEGGGVRWTRAGRVVTTLEVLTDGVVASDEVMETLMRRLFETRVQVVASHRGRDHTLTLKLAEFDGGRLKRHRCRQVEALVICLLSEAGAARSRSTRQNAA